MTSLIVAFVCVLLPIASRTDTPLYCPSPTRSPAAKLSILNYRNAAGQWTSRLNFTRDVLGDAPVWDIDLVQEKTTCADGGEFVTILLTLTSLPVEVEVVPTQQAPPQVTALKPGYQEVPDVGISKLYTTAKTWVEAREICAKDGTHLAIINSDAEATYYKNTLEKHKTFSDSTDNNYVFLGFEYSLAQERFVTIQGNELTSSGYVVWGESQPNNMGDKNYSCGGMDRTGKLHDVNCDARLGFFCEQ